MFVCISEDDNGIEPIKSMPGISRYGLNQLKKHLDLLIGKGLKSILVFGVVEGLPKVCCKSVYVFLI